MIQSTNAGLPLDQEKFEQYLKTLSGKEKENAEKLAAVWMYKNNINSLRSASMRKPPPGGRPIMLIPATPTGSQILPTSAAPVLLPAPALLPPGLAPYQRGMTLPYMRPSSVIYAHPAAGSLNSTYRTFKSTKSAGQKRKKRSGNMIRPGKMEPNRRQRCRSEADILNKAEAFQYKGLDRAIADSFLARQEQSNAGSHIDYSSSTSSASDTYGSKTRVASRASSKTKIICRDFKM